MMSTNNNIEAQVPKLLAFFLNSSKVWNYLNTISSFTAMDSRVYIDTMMLGNSDRLDTVKVEFNKANSKHTHAYFCGWPTNGSY